MLFEMSLHYNIISIMIYIIFTLQHNYFLIENHARYVYKKVESGNIINTNTLKQEIDQDQELNRLDDTS